MKVTALDVNSSFEKYVRQSAEEAGLNDDSF